MHKHRQRISALFGSVFVKAASLVVRCQHKQHALRQQCCGECRIVPQCSEQHELQILSKIHLRCYLRSYLVTSSGSAAKTVVCCTTMKSLVFLLCVWGLCSWALAEEEPKVTNKVFFDIEVNSQLCRQPMTSDRSTENLLEGS